MKALEITGQRFERLLVLEKAEYTKSRHTKWLCRCDCGKEKVIWGLKQALEVFKEKRFEREAAGDKRTFYEAMAKVGI